MEDFYKKLKDFKDGKGFNYKALGKIIDKKEAAMRMAVKRETLTLLEEERLEKFFAEYEQKEKTPLGDVRFEDMIADKMYERLLPVFEAYANKIMEAVVNLHYEIEDIKIKQEKIERSQETCSENQKETRQILEIIGKKF